MSKKVWEVTPEPLKRPACPCVPGGLAMLQPMLKCDSWWGLGSRSISSTSAGNGDQPSLYLYKCYVTWPLCVGEWGHLSIPNATWEPSSETASPTSICPQKRAAAELSLVPLSPAWLHLGQWCVLGALPGNMIAG